MLSMNIAFSLVFTPYLSNALVALKLLVSLISCLVACSVRIVIVRQTNRQTDTQTNYCNPRCACAPRVNEDQPTTAFTMKELEAGISTLTPGKAIGLNNISIEQMKYFGSEAKRVFHYSLPQHYNKCLATHKLPNIWRKAHIIALLKPKPNQTSIGSQELLANLTSECHTYKLFECLILTGSVILISRLISRLHMC